MADTEGLVECESCGIEMEDEGFCMCCNYCYECCERTDHDCNGTEDGCECPCCNETETE